MLDGYVINLRSRPDRLAGFQHRMAPFRSQIRINFFPAVDCKDLDLEDIKPRVNPWNFEHLNEDRLRGVLGCALSHLSVWKIIAASEAPLAFVFEDDVAIRDPTEIAAIAPRQSLQDIELMALDEVAPEPVKVRSRLRLTAIMTALYVRQILHTVLLAG